MAALTAFLHYALIALGVMLLFCLAIVIHEFGHFLAAKLLGFKIDAFSICFGPALWKRKIGGVEYRVGCIPLGGYVALPQLDPSSMDSIQGKHDQKDGKAGNGDGVGEGTPPPPVAAWKRIVVAFAGPFGNVVLAVVLAFAIFAFAPADEFGGYGTVVGQVAPQGPAEAAGLKPGDKLVSVGNEKVSFWSEVIIECHFSGNTNNGISAVVLRDGREIPLQLPVVRDEATGYLRIPGVTPQRKCAVAEVMPGHPAKRAGLMAGDLILSVNGREPTSPTDAVSLIGAAGTNALALVVRRKGVPGPIAIGLAAAYSEEHGRAIIGASFTDPASGIPQWMMFRRPGQQLSGDAKAIFRILRALFAPKAKGESKRAAKDMGGPGTLLFVLWNEVEAGIFHSMAFLRFLCINLAILNLLPIPVLDGGHILFALLEIITRRKPSPKVVDWVTTAFAILLIGLMAILLFRDAVRIHKFTREARAEQSSSRK